LEGDVHGGMRAQHHHHQEEVQQPEQHCHRHRGSPRTPSEGAGAHSSYPGLHGFILIVGLVKIGWLFLRVFWMPLVEVHSILNRQNSSFLPMCVVH
jgi:hypothetical protein